LPLLTKNMITAWICALRNGGRCHGAVFLNCDDTRYGSLAVFLIGLRCLLTGPCTYPQNEYCRFFPNLGTNPVDWSYLNNLIREENRGNASYCKRGAGPGICSDPGGCGPAIHRASRNEARPGAPAGHGEITLGLQPIYPAFLIASPVAASMPCFASRSRGARQSVIPGAGRVARPISAAGIHH